MPDREKADLAEEFEEMMEKQIQHSKNKKSAGLPEGMYRFNVDYLGD